MNSSYIDISAARAEPEYYRLPFGTLITNGVMRWQERHQAHWLVTDISAYSTEIDEPYQFWTLSVPHAPDRKPGGLATASLTCVADEGLPPLKEVTPIFTDMPEGEHRLWLIRGPGSPDVIMLPEEY